MTEADWLAGTDVDAMVRYAAERLSTRRQRLLAAGFCRVMLPNFEHPELIDHLTLLERYADGLLTEGEAEKARQRCRTLAQQAAFSEADGSAPAGFFSNGRADIFWAFAFAFNYSPVPLREVSIRASGGVWPVEDERVPRLWRVVHDVAGNPFSPVAFAPEWRTDTAVALARTMYEAREFSAMPILADALQDAGCDSDDVLNHCREPGEHVRGCWVVDAVLGMG